jgi:hypothetical protein
MVLDCFLGIIADGTTDQEILSTLIRCQLFNAQHPEIIFQEIMLRQKITDVMGKYRNRLSKTSDYSISSDAAIEFRNGIILAISAGLYEFQQEVTTRELTGHDLLILNTDSEIFYRSPSDYFLDWVFVYQKNLFLAIEEYYDRIEIRHKRPMEKIPIIIPIVLFPSTDILIGAIKSSTDVFQYINMPARDIKKNIYGTDNLYTLKDDELKTLVLDIINPESCMKIYHYIPEIRYLFKTLYGVREILSLI